MVKALWHNENMEKIIGPMTTVQGLGPSDNPVKYLSSNENMEKL